MVRNTVTPDLEQIILTYNPMVRFGELVQSDGICSRIKRIIREYSQMAKLKKYGLRHSRKIMLVGPHGTGKTLTANILAGELDLPLFTITMDNIGAKSMEYKSDKLSQIFDIIHDRRGVYLFDNIDAIGETRLYLNEFVRLIERHSSDSLIVAETNTPRHLLPPALRWHFDEALSYYPPDEADIERLIENRLGSFCAKDIQIKKLAKIAKSLRHSDVCQACNNAIKEAIIADRGTVTETILKQTLQERHQ